MEHFSFSILLVLSIVLIKQGSGEQSPMASLVAAALSQYSDYVKLKASASDNTLEKNKEDDPETRGGGGGGGYGGGHGGGHGHGYGAITLDPVSIISLLALGAFLINNILQLLRANAPAPAGGGKRSFGSSIISDAIFPTFSNTEDGSRTTDGEPNFGKFFENVGSLYYLQPKKRNLCIKKVVCGYLSVQQSREGIPNSPGNFKTSVFDFMLSTISRFVVPELSTPSQMKDEGVCKKFNKLCSDSLLQDAKISVKNKVYNEMSNLISALTVGGMGQLMG